MVDSGTSTRILQCKGLSVGYGRRPVAQNINFSMDAGVYLGVVGPNGCGKTTLLKTILGILRPLGGTLEWPGVARPAIGYVPQRDAIDPIYTFRALDIVALALGTESMFRPTLSAANRKRAMEALDRVGLTDFYNKSYGDLSGGQRQRVLFARALALQPRLLALDEPTSGLDPGNTERTLDIIDEIRESQHLTVLLVSHDLALVARRATHALAMHEGNYVFGESAATITGPRLSELYKYPMRVERSGGSVAVFPAKDARSR